MIVYEYPFNERIRTLLRLEYLYERFTFFVKQAHAFEHQVALSTIFEMLEVAGRADLKSDLIQELDRQRQILVALLEKPHINGHVSKAMLEELDVASHALMSAQGKTGQHIRENEWLMSIRGRTIIPGGACEFDLPSYYAWQHHTSEARYTDIMNWFTPLIPLFTATRMILYLLRGTGRIVELIAKKGRYQEILSQGLAYQMARVKLEKTLNIVPEVSAHKYMLSVRFTEQQKDLKPKSFDEDVSFQLALCHF